MGMFTTMIYMGRTTQSPQHLSQDRELLKFCKTQGLALKPVSKSSDICHQSLMNAVASYSHQVTQLLKMDLD